MRKINYLAVVVFATLLFLGCKKSEESTSEPAPVNPPVVAGITVEEKNMSLVNKFTGSLCGPCGSWGWSMFEEIIANGGDDVCNMGTYSQNFVAQNFITTAATDMDKAYGAAKMSSGYPSFSVNGVCQLDRTSGVNTTSEKQKCMNAISTHKSATCQVNSGYEVTYDATKANITVKTKVKFFKDMTGQYYVSAYIVEDKVLGTQSGKTGIVEHHDVLRGSIGSTTFGTLITSATTTGSTFEHTFTGPVTAGWKTENFSIVTAIWKKNGTKYEFVNAYRKI